MFAKSALVAAVLALLSCAYAHDQHVWVRGGGESNNRGIGGSAETVYANTDDESFVKLESAALEWTSLSKAEIAGNGVGAASEHRAHRTLQARIMNLENPCLEDIVVLLVMYQLPNGMYSGGFLTGGLKSKQSMKIGVNGLSGQDFYVYAKGSKSIEVKGDSSFCVTARGQNYCPAKVNGGSGSQLTYSFSSACGGGTSYSAPTTTTSTRAPNGNTNNGGVSNGGGSNSNRKACTSVDDSSYNICIDAKSTGTYTRDWTTVANAAAERWETVIKGDLSSVDTQPSNVKAALQQFTCNTLPPIIDDTYICFKDANFDGPGGVLGRAGPIYVRQESGLPINGEMEFDSGDIQWMTELGTLEGVMTHEMGHVLGIGSQWIDKGLVSIDGTVNEGGRIVNNHVYNGPNACQKWREITGCSGGCPPVENGGGEGTQGGHWDEAVMNNELMTGSTGGALSRMPLSEITVGTLEDLGYTVDYSQADPYTVTGQNICGRRTTTTKVRQLKKGHKHKGHHGKEGSHYKKKKKLSEAGRAAATKFGKETLAKAHAERPEVEPEGMVYVADKFVSIIMIEEGELYSLEMTGI